MGCAVFTGVLGNVVQQQWILGESQHLHRNDVFQLQPATQTISLSCLRNRKKEGNRSCRELSPEHSLLFQTDMLVFPHWFPAGQTVGSRSDLHEKGEPLVLLLLTLDELQCRWQVAAESTYCTLYLLLFLTTKLEDPDLFIIVVIVVLK